MGLSHLSFRRDWKNPADFPTVEPDEATVRADLQYHPDAIKDYINGTLIPSHDSLTYAKHSHDNKTVLDGITADDVAKLAQEPLYGTTLTLTPTQVYDAVSAEIPVKVQYFDGTYGSLSFTVFNVVSQNMIVSQRIVYAKDEYILAELRGNKPNGTWNFVTTTLAEKTDIPSLEGYATEAYVQNYHDNTKQDKLIAGEGITIAADGKTISSSSKVSSVNGQTGDVVLDADTVGAQKPLIAGSGITITPSDNGDIIQSNTSGSVGNGLVSFVDNGVSIAQFTLNQMQDCEINVNNLTEHLHNRIVDLETSDNRLEASLSNNYRTAAAQDVIDNTKLTDAPTDGKAYARKNGSWSEVAVVDVGVESVNGKTGVVTLNATEIPSTKLVPTDTISFLIDGAFDEALVGLTLNGASASANDFISAVNSGSTVTVSLHDQGNTKVTFKDTPVKYKITNDTLSLCFIAETGHTYTPAIYVLSGPTSGTAVSDLVEHRFTDSLYQEHYVSANDLPVQAPLTVEQYLEALEARIAALENPQKM